MLKHMESNEMQGGKLSNDSSKYNMRTSNFKIF